MPNITEMQYFTTRQNLEKNILTLETKQFVTEQGSDLVNEVLKQ